MKVVHAEQVHDKLPLCFKGSLNSSRDWHSFKFAGKLFHKKHFLWILMNLFHVPGCLRLELGGEHLFSEKYGKCSSTYAFHIKLGIKFISRLMYFNG